MTKFQYYIKIYLHYGPEICRFINADTVEYLDPETINGLNLYAYCTNNPVNYSDPTGHFAIATLIIGLLIGFSVGGAIMGGVSAGIAGEDVFAGF